MRVTRRISAMFLGAAMAVLPSAPAVAGPVAGGTFDPFVEIAPGATAVAVADLNGDHIPDLATGGGRTAGGIVTIYPGIGNGRFGSPQSFNVLNGSRSVAAGDINGDGRADLAVAAQSQVELFLQTPAGALVRGAVLSVEAEKVKVADVTGDGRADVIVIGWGREAVTVYPQTAAGGLGPPATYTVPLGGYNDLEVGDVNGDGRNDIVAMSGQLNAVPNLTVLVQQTDGTLVVRGSYSVAPFDTTQGVGIGDIDGDGRAEVVVSHGGNRPFAKLTVFKAASDGSLSISATVPVADNPSPVEVADVDRDGYADVVVAHEGWEEVSVLYGSPQGLQLPAEVLAVPYASYDPHAMALADVDQDGDRDIVLTGGLSTILLRNRVVRADLKVGLTSLTTTARVGQAVAQTATVRNDGTVPLGGKLRISLPSVLRLQRWTDPSCQLANQALDCALPVVQPGGTYTVTVVFVAYSTGVAQTTATLLPPSSPDDYPNNNFASVGVTVVASSFDARVRAKLDQMISRGLLR